jgi:acetyltransferase-like isoleucine patch superfamily enzyme
MTIFVKILRYINRNSIRKELHRFGNIDQSLKIGYNHDLELNKNLKSLTLNKNIKFYNNVSLTVGANAILEIGENTTINKYTSIVSLEKITIGKNCLIGENVKIYDNDHKVETIDDIKFTSHKEFTTSTINIGDNCWLASNVTILKGVQIGDNCIIGAGCMIHKNIPANSTVINNSRTILIES